MLTPKILKDCLKKATHQANNEQKKLSDMYDIQKKAKSLGHCVCSKLFTCECKYFKDEGICRCNGDNTGLTFEEWLTYNK